MKTWKIQPIIRGSYGTPAAPRNFDSLAAGADTSTEREETREASGHYRLPNSKDGRQRNFPLFIAYFFLFTALFFLFTAVCSLIISLHVFVTAGRYLYVSFFSSLAALFFLIIANCIFFISNFLLLKKPAVSRLHFF